MPFPDRAAAFAKIRTMVQTGSPPPSPGFPVSGQVRAREDQWREILKRLAGRELLTIGHSTMAWEEFAPLLTKAQVAHLVDVRTTPFSKRAPWSNREELEDALARLGLGYTWLGPELGGRPPEEFLWKNGRVDYLALARLPRYQQGLARLYTLVLQGVRVCLLCSEENPAHCHRKWLIARSAHEHGLKVRHIRRYPPEPKEGAPSHGD